MHECWVREMSFMMGTMALMVRLWVYGLKLDLHWAFEGEFLKRYLYFVDDFMWYIWQGVHWAQMLGLCPRRRSRSSLSTNGCRKTAQGPVFMSE